MDENFRPAEPDLAAAGGCRNELTRANSDSSSITVDNSKHFARRNANDRPHMAWTNEKHNSYLEALEASFVKQLHHSLGMFINDIEESTCDSSSSKKLPVNTCNFSDQFAVLQDGSRQKISFEKHYASGSHVVTESPWICHFRSSGKENTKPSAELRGCNIFCGEGMPLRGTRIFSHGSPSLGQSCAFHRGHHDEVGNITEVSDQNFVDEYRRENSDKPPAKRLKMAAADTSIEDQILASGNFLPVGTSTVKNMLSRREERLNHESENFESFVHPEPDVESFLRES